NLQYLNISHNLVQRIEPSNYRSLSLLRELDLSFNQMMELATSSFDGLNSLEILQMTNEPYLHSIKLNAFSGLINLRKLNLSSCHILEKIDENAFEYGDRLEILDLSNCQLKRLPQKLVAWTNLKSLHISGNPLHCDCDMLSFLPEVLRKFPINATCFTPPWLFDKNIMQLLNAFSGLINLRKLNLSSCHILEKIDENAFEYGDRLEILDLSNCQLKRLPQKLVAWTNLKSLHISGNPLHCDCDMLSFLPEVLRKFPINATCFTPPWLFDKNIMQLSENCTTLNESQLSIAIIGASLLFLTILLLLGICIGRHFPLCNKISSTKYRTRNKCRSQLYSKPFLITSPINDKSDLLSEQTCYTTANRSTSNGFSRSTGLYDDEGYYSSVMFPAEYNAYERARPIYPIPPPAATIPQTLPKSFADDNFRIISEYPVPITEL
ncbi:unnamed protein product, partial [Brugia pahangi]|uniref:LRRCT domain-containing protein n=1 Tax=Brugia pahangi TaxID=6280 RepID=A0A0N4T5R9_BRUPA